MLNILLILVIYFFVFVEYIDSPYKTAIDIAIVALQQKGTLLNLKQKWWEEMDNEAKCQVSNIRNNLWFIVVYKEKFILNNIIYNVKK